MSDQPRLTECKDTGGAMNECRRDYGKKAQGSRCLSANNTLKLMKAIYHIDPLPLPSKAKIILSSWAEGWGRGLNWRRQIYWIQRDVFLFFFRYRAPKKISYPYILRILCHSEPKPRKNKRGYQMELIDYCRVTILPRARTSQVLRPANKSFLRLLMAFVIYWLITFSMTSQF